MCGVGRRQFGILPVAAFYEPVYASGKAERWEIADTQGAQLGIAGIWEYKQDGPNRLPMLLFTMLTINADDHPLMWCFHKPDDEIRMLVILAPEQYDDRLACPLEDTPHFFTQYPAERLTAHPAPRSGAKPAPPTLLDL